ncbi:MAG: DNA repair protein RecO [bacterium]|nr:DNA repair protein RecO [bacterium]
MQRISSRAIILSRRDYGEADRIINFLTDDHGKVIGIAKGVKKPKSKMAGGLELFSIVSISFLVGSKELKTIVSTELITHFGNIAADLNKTLWLYDVLKLMQKSLPESCDSEYFDLLRELMGYLNEKESNLWSSQLWFYSRWLELHGQQFDTQWESGGQELSGEAFFYSLENKGFISGKNGNFTLNHIKLVRLAAKLNPQKLSQVVNGDKLALELNKVLMKASQQVV